MPILTSYMLSTPTQVAGTHLMAVLTEDTQKQKAVYLAIVSMSVDDDHYEAMNKAEEFAAYHGSKQSYTHALSFFPELTKREYRA